MNTSRLVWLIYLSSTFWSIWSRLAASASSEDRQAPTGHERRTTNPVPIFSCSYHKPCTYFFLFSRQHYHQLQLPGRPNLSPTHLVDVHNEISVALGLEKPASHTDCESNLPIYAEPRDCCCLPVISPQGPELHNESCWEYIPPCFLLTSLDSLLVKNQTVRRKFSFTH
jgi:hypothetical protein